MARGGMIRPGLRVQSAPRVEVDCRTAYDFVLVIAGDSGDIEDLLPEDRRWLEATRKQLPEDLRRDSHMDGCEAIGFTVELSHFIFLHPEVKTASDLVRVVDGLSDRELARELFAELLEQPEFATLTRRALDGSVAAFSELKAILEQSKGVQPFAATLEEIVPNVRRAVHAWLEPFESIEQRVARMEEQDASRRRAELAESTDPFEFIERVTNGIRLMPDGRTQRVVLAPSYFGRPYNSITVVGDTQLVAYPIADESLGAADRRSPPQSLIRLYRALGDESRLRILRLLTERDWYLTELATELELSKPTVKHHLAQLRSAGLITVAEEGALTYYTLRRERIAEAGTELVSFLSR